MQQRLRETAKVSGYVGLDRMAFLKQAGPKGLSGSQDASVGFSFHAGSHSHAHSEAEALSFSGGKLLSQDLVLRRGRKIFLTDTKA